MALLFVIVYQAFPASHQIIVPASEVTVHEDAYASRHSCQLELSFLSIDYPLIYVSKAEAFLLNVGAEGAEAF